MNKAILLVFAHPDDESFGLAGTILKYSRQGVPVDLICATRGEKGTRVDVPDNVDTGTAREDELRCAAVVTGIRDIYFLGYVDGELNTVPPKQIRDKVMGLMARLNPEVVITFGPDGITGHPDHIIIGKAATQAFESLVRKGKGPGKLYYVTVPDSAGDEESGIITRPDDEVTTTIDINGLQKKKLEALACHRSQQDARDFIEMLEEAGESEFAEEYLYLAYPRVSDKETDVFE